MYIFTNSKGLELDITEEPFYLLYPSQQGMGRRIQGKAGTPSPDRKCWCSVRRLPSAQSLNFMCPPAGHWSRLDTHTHTDSDWVRKDLPMVFQLDILKQVKITCATGIYVGWGIPGRGVHGSKGMEVCGMPELLVGLQHLMLSSEDF